MKHPTDNAIQSYLHDPGSPERAPIMDHLKNCPDCRKQLLLYERLKELVVSSSFNSAPDNFETAVMARIRSRLQQRRVTDIVMTATAMIGFVFIGLIIFLTPQLKHAAAEYLMDAWQYAGKLITITGDPSDAAVVLVFGVGLMVLFGLVDRIAIGRLRSATSSGN
ncbi:MAG: hypothetical protein JSU65_09390 [Candidatus Zixiibacteriota bacterium]|nr:MAG: hypothetical protein JSU65_09390 [candidate division Zixibacteria bacterium]